MTAATVDTTLAPWMEWSRVHNKVNKMWDPVNCPHHSIIGLTGSGKSFLVVNGLLKMCESDRVLIIDTKGDDPLISNLGRAVKELPHDTWGTGRLGRRKEPRDHWFRISVEGNLANPAHRKKEQARVWTALDRAYNEGNWVIFADEVKDLTDPRAPGLGMGPWVDQIWRKGRSKRVSLIAATQAPAWVPRSFYDQASFAWIGRLRDRERQKRLLEIGGMHRDALPIVESLQRREWLLAADNGEFFLRTKVTVKGGE